MGIMLKSTIGLGTVYFLMFAPTAERPALGPIASLCAEAANARAQGVDTFASQAQAARCVMALGVAAAHWRPRRRARRSGPAPGAPP